MTGIDIDEPFDSRIHAYRVFSPEGSGRVLVWYDGDRLVGSLSDGNADAEKIIAAERDDPFLRLASEAASLPDAISSHELFDIDAEIGNIPGGSNSDCYQDVVGGFFRKVLGSDNRDADKMRLLDIGCGACESYRAFDASEAVDIIAELSKGVEWKVSPGEFDDLAFGRRSSSGEWIVRSAPGNLIDHAISTVFGDGSRGAEAIGMMCRMLDSRRGEPGLPAAMISGCATLHAARNGILRIH